MKPTIVTRHGESRSLFYVVDKDAPPGEQPAILRTFVEREVAEAYVKSLKLESEGNPSPNRRYK